MNGAVSGKPRHSYSQCGEDLIIDFIFRDKAIALPSFLDLGAYDPFELSNTALFSGRGATGVNVEANPVLFENLRRGRPNDLNLNLGIGPCDAEPGLEFYVMAPSVMSTFSADEAARLERETSVRVVQKLQVPTITMATLLEGYLSGKFPDFLTCDIECLDHVVVAQLALIPVSALPDVICIETLTYSEKGDARKKLELIEAVVAIGYSVHADTFINTIFRKNGF